jgi:hypothetical protein
MTKREELREKEAYRVLHLVEWLASRKTGTKHSSENTDDITIHCRTILRNKNNEYWRELYYD